VEGTAKKHVFSSVGLNSRETCFLLCVCVCVCVCVYVYIYMYIYIYILVENR
jgi:hypothetical protein